MKLYDIVGVAANSPAYFHFLYTHVKSSIIATVCVQISGRLQSNMFENVQVQ